METASRRYIDVTNEAKARLARALNCTEQFVYMALTYRKDSELACKVRYVAVNEYHGKPMGYYPECETLHNITEDGRQIMRQNFDNGVRLEIDKQTGAAVMFDRKGAVLCTRQIEKIPELAELQLFAESL